MDGGPLRERLGLDESVIRRRIRRQEAGGRIEWRAPLWGPGGDEPPCGVTKAPGYAGGRLLCNTHSLE